MPKILFQLHPTRFVEIMLLPRLLVLLAVVHRVVVDRCLRVGFGVVDDGVEEGVRVEVEDGDVGVAEGEAGGEGGEARVPGRDRAGRDGVAPFAGEGHAIKGRDVEDEEVARAGLVELLVARRVSCGMEREEG